MCWARRLLCWLQSSLSEAKLLARNAGGVAHLHSQQKAEQNQKLGKLTRLLRMQHGLMGFQAVTKRRVALADRVTARQIPRNI